MKANSGPELLQRRDRTIPRFTMKYWNDHRAWLSSCLFHTIALLVIAWLYRPVSRGTQGELDRPVGIAVVHQTGRGSDYFLMGGSSASASQDSAKASEKLATVEVDTPGATSLEELVADLLPNETTANGDGSGQNALGEGTAGTGTGNLSGSGPGAGKGINQTTTTFLGVEGTGASFVYVLDRSDSMNTQSGAPLYLAKKELLQSIESLNPGNQFQVVFYNESPSPLAGARGGRNRLLSADKTEKGRATQFVRNVIASGGTEHIPALRTGLSYGPEVLFFMTDGDLPGITQSEMDDIQERASRTGTTIHTIQFRSGPPETDGGWIRALAERNRGKYRYVNVDELKVD